MPLRTLGVPSFPLRELLFLAEQAKTQNRIVFRNFALPGFQLVLLFGGLMFPWWISRGSANVGILHFVGDPSLLVAWDCFWEVSTLPPPYSGPKKRPCRGRNPARAVRRIRRRPGARGGGFRKLSSRRLNRRYYRASICSALQTRDMEKKNAPGFFGSKTGGRGNDRLWLFSSKTLGAPWLFSPNLSNIRWSTPL